MGCSPTKEDSSSSNQPVNGVKSVRVGTKSVIHEAAEAGKYSYMKSYTSDPRCPLTERQLYTITKSWKAINREISATAINMFVRLFEQNKDVAQYFGGKFDANVTVSDLRSNQSFESHAMVVICTIDEIISNLDDMDYVNNLIDTVSSTHINIFGRKNPNTFYEIEKPFMQSVKETLGDRFTISLEQAYQITIQFILKSLVEGLKSKCNVDSTDEKTSLTRQDIIGDEEITTTTLDT